MSKSKEPVYDFNAELPPLMGSMVLLKEVDRRPLNHREIMVARITRYRSQNPKLVVQKFYWDSATAAFKYGKIILSGDMGLIDYLWTSPEIKTALTDVVEMTRDIEEGRQDLEKAKLDALHQRHASRA